MERATLAQKLQVNLALECLIIVLFLEAIFKTFVVSESRLEIVLLVEVRLASAKN